MHIYIYIVFGGPSNRSLHSFIGIFLSMCFGSLPGEMWPLQNFAHPTRQQTTTAVTRADIAAATHVQSGSLEITLPVRRLPQCLLQSALAISGL